MSATRQEELRRDRRARRIDALVIGVLRIVAGTAGIVVVLILGFLVAGSIEALQSIGFGRFFTDSSWHPAHRSDEGTFLVIPMIAGSIAVTAGAVLIAAPFGVLSAVFVHFYAPASIAGVYRRVIELLGGIPSVVYGFWGLTVLVPLILAIQPPGQSLLAGILVLAIMIVPLMALSADAAIGSVPRDLLRAAAALGMSRATVIRTVVLPHARAAFISGGILQTGRAIGETMVVVMVCGNVVRMPGSLFDPVRTLTANIALELAYALGDHRSALFVTGLLLMGVVIALVAAAEVMNRRQVHAVT